MLRGVFGGQGERFLLFSAVIVLLGVAASLLTTYGVQHALAGSDTGFSRALLPVFVVMGMAILSMIKSGFAQSPPVKTF